jgi:hypothetical protein
VAEQKKKSGGFQSMGLGQAVFRGVVKKGYKVPTPIQRRVSLCSRHISQSSFHEHSTVKLVMLVKTFNYCI